MPRLLPYVIAVVSMAGPTIGTVAQPEVRLVLPPDIYATVGHEVNIYFDNVALIAQPDSVRFDVTCGKGRQDEARWRFAPTADDVGDYGLTLTVTDPELNVIAESAATIHVAAADAGAGEAVSLMCVGDSLTHASVYPNELWRLFGEEGSTALTMVGTHHPIDSLPAEVVHEGYGGWSWQLFCTRWTDGDDARARSPFLRLDGETPVLDFQGYCEANNAGEGPDYITVLLGCNDTFSAKESEIEDRIDMMFTYADTLIAEFQAVRPDTRIGLLLLVPPAASQDAFGTNYASGQTRWQYRRNQHRVVERMMEKFAGREADGIWLLPAHLNVDTVSNYPTRTEPANARTEATIDRQSNGVHPSATGYLQIADTIYAWMRHQLAQ